MARPILISRFLLVDAPGAVELADDPRARAPRDVIGWDNLGASVRWQLSHGDGRSVEIAVSRRTLAGAGRAFIGEFERLLREVYGVG